MATDPAPPQSPGSLRPAVFFDRDGTLNTDRGYTYRPEDLEFMPGAPEAIAGLNRRGILAIVVSNQSGVGRGLYDEAAVDAFHARMQLELAQAGGRIDAFYYCPFHQDAIVARYRIANHPDRKPNPGMILRAMAEWRVDRSRALLIGDRLEDMQAASAAGVRGLPYQGGDLASLVQAHTHGWLQSS